MQARPGYQSLLVWQRAMALAKEAYLLAGGLPQKEQFALADQMRRSSVSIPSNIAEGSRRGTRKDFAHFLRIAHGSLAELETQLLLVQELYPRVQVGKSLEMALEVGRMLHAFTKVQES